MNSGDAGDQSGDYCSAGAVLPQIRHESCTHAIALAGMVAWPLTGRDEELQLIAATFGNESEHGGVAIVGRSGVGKTRLAREAAAVATGGGWVVRRVSGTAAAQAIPLGAFAEWIDQTGGQPLNLVGAVIASIVDTPNGEPVVLVVDDAHLLDDLSAFLLHQLVRRRAAVVIATVRAGHPTPETVSALWKDSDLRRLDLQSLSRPQSDALLEATLGGPLNVATAQRLWELTRGNVLFLHEIVRQECEAARLSDSEDGWQWTGEMTASPTLVDLVHLHMGAASESVLEVVDLVAMAEPLELGCLLSMTNVAAVEEAERRELITVSSASPAGLARVAQPLYAEARRAHMGQMRSARLRGRLATAMNQPIAGLGSPDPLRLGLLWLESDLPADADVYLRGALAAFVRLDLVLTQRLAAAAVDAGAGVEAHLLHAQSLTRLGRSDEAQQILSDLPVRQDRDLVWATAVTMRAASLLFTPGLAADSWAVIDEAVDSAPEGLVPQLHAFKVVQLAMAARPHEAVELGRSIDSGQLSALAATILACAMTIALGDIGQPDAAASIAEDGNRRAASSPQAAYQAVALNLVYVDALVLSGRIREAVALGDRVCRLWADIPRVPHTVAVAINGMTALAHGDLAEARVNIQAALEETESRADSTGLPYLLLVAYTETLARSGDVEGALQARDRMEAHRHPAYVFMESARLLARGWVAAARGRTSEAVALVSQAAEFARAQGQHARETMCLQVAIQFGDHRHASRLGELVELTTGPRGALVQQWANALVGSDADELMSISRRLEDMGDNVAAADAAAHAAGIFKRDNRNGARLTASGRATALATACGASTVATKLAATSLPLSNREREIATLVSQGMSNQQIADTLVTSRRTVEGHIYRACQRLGLKDRIELAAVMRESGLA